MSRSSRNTPPERGRTSPEIVRSSVDLPAPLAPSTAVMLEAGTSNETSSSATTAP